jgi:hypothetical protein
MTVPTVACTNCGKNFTTDDLRGTSCKYCGTLLAHHARAQEQIAVVSGMLADRNGNGIPDAYEGLVANAQANAMNQAFGVNVMNNPYGPPPGGYGHPGYGAPHAMMNPVAAMHVQQAGRTVNKVFLVVAIIVGLSVLLSVLGGALAFFFLAR